MTAKTKTTETVPGAEVFETVGKAFEQAATQGRRMIESGAHAWTDEAHRFVERLSADAADTYQKLSACQTPLDVLQVEQEWLAARTKAYMEAGSRLVHAVASPPKATDAA